MNTVALLYSHLYLIQNEQESQMFPKEENWDETTGQHRNINLFGWEFLWHPSLIYCYYTSANKVFVLFLINLLQHMYVRVREGGRKGKEEREGGERDKE